MGREELLQRISREISRLPTRGTQACFIQANYGEGKTHLLHAVWDLAERANCVVSFIILSQETPFDKLHQVYPKLIANTYLPRSTQPGIEQLLMNIHPGSNLARDLMTLAQEELHPRLNLILRNWFSGHNVAFQDNLVRDLSGDLLNTQELKAIHRLNFGEGAFIGGFSKTRDIWDYYRLIDTLVTLRQYQGWVILFDEAELIGRLSLGSRAKAYANIARFLSPSGGLNQTFSVFAFASSFYSDVLGYRNDIEQAAAWLELRGQEEDAQAVRDVEKAIRKAEVLPSLNEDQLHRVMEQLVRAHAEAYSWVPQISPYGLLQRVMNVLPHPDTKLRTRVRAAIHWLDHLFQYGQDPQLAFSELSEDNLMKEQTQDLEDDVAVTQED